MMETTYQSEQDTLDDDLPAISEFEEFLRFHPASFCKSVQHSFCQSDQHGCHKKNKDEENQSGHEDVGLLDAGTEADSIDSSDDFHFTDRARSV